MKQRLYVYKFPTSLKLFAFNNYNYIFYFSKVIIVPTTKEFPIYSISIYEKLLISFCFGKLRYFVILKIILY